MIIINKYITVAIKEALTAKKNKEVPIGAVIVKNGKIIAKASNKRIKKHDVTNHAEIIAIRKAEKKLKDWRLNDCDIYVTLEPCSMCMEIIKAARINNIYYLVEKLENKKEYNRTNVQKMKISDTEIEKLYIKELSEFFRINCKR